MAIYFSVTVSLCDRTLSLLCKARCSWIDVDGPS